MTTRTPHTTTHRTRTIAGVILAAGLIAGPIAATFTPAVAATGAAGKVAVTEADKDKEIAVKIGQVFTLTLPENASTGYSWYLLTGPNPFDLVSRVSKPSTKNLPGAPGTVVFTFKAKTAGAAYLRLLSLRPFEPGVDASGLWQVHVTVNK